MQHTVIIVESDINNEFKMRSTNILVETDINNEFKMRSTDILVAPKVININPVPIHNTDNHIIS